MNPEPNEPARARPFWIETPAGALFAWHHAPSGEPREAAVVLCRPFGYDAQCTQRAYRHLAERLRDAGFHVLRLDYHGTGDSSGDDVDDDRVPAWSRSIAAAAEWSRAELGVGKVALFGTGLGGLLAIDAASRGDVDALALFAPPRSGNAWLREARALSRLGGAGGPPKQGAPTDGEESAGFLVTGATAEAIRKLGPSSIECVARANLVIARDDLPGAEEKWIEAFQAKGASAVLSRTPGYGAMIQDDPHKSIVPERAWGEIAAWLTERYARTSPVPAGLPAYPHVAIVHERGAAPEVREEVVDIEGLFGILTEPAHAADVEALPAIVLHNIGANSRVGANRMYVRMARRWAARGFRVLRFDTTGLGDSPATLRTPENRVYSEGATRDSRRAMDFLARIRKTKRFVLMGLCSGAYVSYHSALADDRVVAIVLMNILLFRWKEGDSVDVRKREMLKSTRFYSKAFLGRDAWARLLRGEVDVGVVAPGLLDKAWQHLRHRIGEAFWWENEVAQGFHALSRRGTNVLLVFDADDGGRDVIDAHLGTNADRFRGVPGFDLEVIDGSDHTFSPLWAQEHLLTLLTRHLTRLFDKT